VDEYQSAFGDSSDVAARLGKTSYDSPISNLKRDETQKKVLAALIRGSPVDKKEFNKDPSGYQATTMYKYSGEPKWGVAKNKDMNLSLAKLTIKENYKCLGTGANEWVDRFMRQLERAQLASGFCWSESVKMDVLEMHSEGKPLEYWQIK
jgi:hypothetical protein